MDERMFVIGAPIAGAGFVTIKTEAPAEFERDGKRIADLMLNCLPWKTVHVVIRELASYYRGSWDNPFEDAGLVDASTVPSAADETKTVKAVQAMIDDLPDRIRRELCLEP